MSINAGNHYVQEYNAQAIHVYQSVGFTLRTTTTPPMKITGEKMHFPVFGSIEAEEDVKRGDVAKPVNGADTDVQVDTKKSRAFVEVYEDDLDQMTVDRKQAEAKRAAMALGRVHDRTIITALKTATQVKGAYATLGSVQLLVQSKQQLQANDVGVEDGNVFAAVDSVTWAQLTGDKRFNNSDYVGPALPYVQGNLAKTWNGIHVFCVSDKTLRTGNTGTDVDCLMWHRSAIGFGYVRELTTTVDWDNRKDCWTHNMRMRIGSKLLLPEGVVKMKALYDPASISIPAAS